MIRKVSLTAGALLFACTGFVPQALADDEPVNTDVENSVEIQAAPAPVELPVAKSDSTNSVDSFDGTSVKVELPVKETDEGQDVDNAEDSLISGLINPVRNASVTSSFGYRIHPITGSSKLHAGIDYGASCGTPVYAPADGVVTLAEWKNDTAGNAINIQHNASEVLGNAETDQINEETNTDDASVDESLTDEEKVESSVDSDDRTVQSNYHHLTSVEVSVGDEVTQGQFIGYVGTTGSSTGCHLHFETEVNGSPVDPKTLLTDEDYDSSVYGKVVEKADDDSESDVVEDADVSLKNEDIEK